MNIKNINTISFQGIEGANSHLACKKLFSKAKVIPCETFEEVFDRTTFLSGSVIAVTETLPNLPMYSVPAPQDPMIGHYQIASAANHALICDGPKVARFSQKHPVGQTRRSSYQAE